MCARVCPFSLLGEESKGQSRRADGEKRKEAVENLFCGAKGWFRWLGSLCFVAQTPLCGHMFSGDYGGRPYSSNVEWLHTHISLTRIAWYSCALALCSFGSATLSLFPFLSYSRGHPRSRAACWILDDAWFVMRALLFCSRSFFGHFLVSEHSFPS
ncbi:hypothetical protein C8J57DRAFT_329139 [Mycena rebaudengoi]|nr:hypothetical protein C8J57DRAFT_329139 [Mycena rebaudengoi]